MFNRKTVFICLMLALLSQASCTEFRKTTADFSNEAKTDLAPVFTITPEIPVYYEFDCIQSFESPEIGFITAVIDGDSIKAIIDGKIHEIRYIGINTPEYYSNERVAAELATLENKKLVEGKKVYLFKDRSNTDKYQRLLRYVFTDDFFVNFELIKRGFAESKSYFPDISCQNTFIQADE